MMNTMMTATGARALILGAIEASGRSEVLDAICSLYNTTENDISADGDVRICNPAIGHWISDECLVEVANFLGVQ